MQNFFDHLVYFLFEGTKHYTPEYHYAQHERYAALGRADLMHRPYWISVIRDRISDVLSFFGFDRLEE